MRGNILHGDGKRWAAALAVASAVILPFISVLSADDFWMGEDELRDAFAGTTIDGHYSDGRYFTERYRVDMGLEYNEGPREASGHWSVVSGTFCTIYENDPTGGCFRVARVGKNCFEFYFVTRSEVQAEEREFGKPGWTARGWIKGRKATCQDEPIV
ncbi:MAG: hypothetical protein KJ622_02780 [Alphaproteobacteria bacterium]|nr:hypothetical protein [Alphaproteobacteria bacterium]